MRKYHPIRWIKKAYYRVKNGWAPEDTWSMDEWFLRVVPQMLHYLAEHTHGYPGYDEFDTPEKWKAYLHDMAYLFENCTNRAREIKHSFEPDWESEDEENLQLTVNWIKDDAKLAEEQQVMIEDAFEMMSKVFFHLWD